MQEDECGDNTNFVITFAGELLEQAESLIKMVSFNKKAWFKIIST